MLTKEQKSLQDLDKAKAAFDRNIENILNYINDITKYYSVFSVGPERKFKKLINYDIELKLKRAESLVIEAKIEGLKQYKLLNER